MRLISWNHSGGSETVWILLMNIFDLTNPELKYAPTNKI
jgi:hypothetical protein